MLPILLGVAALALLAGCSRHEESHPSPSPSRSDPEPSAPPPAQPTGPRNRWGRSVSLPSSAASVLPFSESTCNGAAPRPERFVIQDARQEYCRLHELLRGGVCRIEGNRINASDERTMISVFSLIPNLGNADFRAVMDHPELRPKLSQLEGLQMYLYSGRPCDFDNLQDLTDLMESYTLYRAAMNAPRAELRQGFAEGRVGCILRRAQFQEEGVHDHQINGVTVHHESSHPTDGIVTPATLVLEGLPATTPVSDCLVVR